MRVAQENLIFLDSRDLINCVEKHQPCGASRLARDLHREAASLVLTFTTVLESIPRTPNQDYAVKFVRRLETIPHVFVPHTEISTHEFKEAVVAFNAGQRPNHSLPIASTWATYVCTFAPALPPPPAALASWNEVPLSEYV